MEQLQLNIEQLERIGFEKVTRYTRDQFGNSKEIIAYEIQCLNSVFYCDPRQEVYRWYYTTKIKVIQDGITIDYAKHPREVANHIHINITTIPELFTVLKVFNVGHTI